jgi:hypothetical protein
MLPPAELALEARALSVKILDEESDSAPLQAARTLAANLKALVGSGDTPREPVARSLQVPTDLVDAWLSQTALLLDHVEDFDDTARSVLAERLAAIAWTWGSVPDDWAESQRREALDIWDSEAFGMLNSETAIG